MWKKKNNPNFQTPTMGLGMMAHIWPNMPKVGQFETSMALIFISNMTPMLKKTSLATQQILMADPSQLLFLMKMQKC